MGNNKITVSIKVDKDIWEEANYKIPKQRSNYIEQCLTELVKSNEENIVYQPSKIRRNIIIRKDLWEMLPSYINTSRSQFIEKQILLYINSKDDLTILKKKIKDKEDELNFMKLQLKELEEGESQFKEIQFFNSDDEKIRKAISGTVRQNVLMRDNYTCQICGATVEDGAKLEIDHIQPLSKGGTNDESNLQVLCQQCNREKHNRTDLLHDKQKLEELKQGGI